MDKTLTTEELFFLKAQGLRIGGSLYLILGDVKKTSHRKVKMY